MQRYPGFPVFTQDPPDGNIDEQSPTSTAFGSNSDASQAATGRRIQEQTTKELRTNKCGLYGMTHPSIDPSRGFRQGMKMSCICVPGGAC